MISWMSVTFDVRRGYFSVGSVLLRSGLEERNAECRHMSSFIAQDGAEAVLISPGAGAKVPEVALISTKPSLCREGLVEVPRRYLVRMSISWNSTEFIQQLTAFADRLLWK